MILTVAINVVMFTGIAYLTIGAILSMLAAFRPQPVLAMTVEDVAPRLSIPLGGWVEPADPEVGLAVEMFAVAIRDYWRTA